MLLLLPMMMMTLMHLGRSVFPPVRVFMCVRETLKIVCYKQLECWPSDYTINSDCIMSPGFLAFYLLQSLSHKNNHSFFLPFA